MMVLVSPEGARRRTRTSTCTCTPLITRRWPIPTRVHKYYHDLRRKWTFKTQKDKFFQFRVVQLADPLGVPLVSLFIHFNSSCACHGLWQAQGHPSQHCTLTVLLPFSPLLLLKLNI